MIKRTIDILKLNCFTSKYFSTPSAIELPISYRSLFAFLLSLDEPRDFEEVAVFSFGFCVTYTPVFDADEPVGLLGVSFSF